MNQEIQAVLNGDSEGCIVCGDCMELLQGVHADMIFADPPDNLGMKYDGYKDHVSESLYHSRLFRWLYTFLDKADVVWFSIFHRHQPYVASLLGSSPSEYTVRLFIWYFNFGQHCLFDCGNNFRPIFRINRNGAKLYPDTIRVPSLRQTKYKDKRGDPRGRVPGDVWEFPRVCGTFKERCRWHPTQHPEALLERAVLLSTKPGDLVVDPFSGTGTTCVAAKRLGRRFIGIEQSELYCEKSRDRVSKVSVAKESEI